jgi:hypothetical protein
MTGPMAGICIYSAVQSTALGVGIILTPVLIRPPENVFIKILRLVQTLNIFRWEFDEVKTVCLPVFIHGFRFLICLCTMQKSAAELTRSAGFACSLLNFFFNSPIPIVGAFLSAFLASRRDRRSSYEASSS